MNAVLKFVRDKTGSILMFLKANVGDGPKFAEKRWMTFFLTSIDQSAKICQIHISVTIMAADNHVQNFLRECEDDIWQIIAETDISLFLRGRRFRTPLLSPLTASNQIQDYFATKVFYKYL